MCPRTLGLVVIVTKPADKHQILEFNFSAATEFLGYKEQVTWTSVLWCT